MSLSERQFVGLVFQFGSSACVRHCFTFLPKTCNAGDIVFMLKLELIFIAFLCFHYFTVCVEVAGNFTVPTTLSYF